MDGELTAAGPDRAQAGFTLIELVVVVAVLAVLAIGAGLAATRAGGPGGASADMARFRSAWTTQRDLAIAGQARLGLEVAADGLRRATHGPGGWTISSSTLPLTRQPALSAAPAQPGAPDIVFLANGRSTPFDIVFPGGTGPAQRCESDGWSELSCDF